MKKILLTVFTLMIGIPIEATDFDIYGRMSPGLWFSKSEGFYEDSVDVDTATGEPIIGTDSFPSNYCTLWPYGTFGFRLMTERIGACVEIGIRQTIYQGFINTDQASLLIVKDHMALFAKKFYVEWFINDMFSLLLGKNDAPACFFSSNQRLFGEYRFRNAGCLYTGSKAMIQFTAGNGLSSTDVAEGFLWEAKVAALKVDTAAIHFRASEVGVYAEAKFPKFEGSVAAHLGNELLSADLEAGGGYQRYIMALHKYNVPAKLSKDEVDCFVTGVSCGARVGPVKLIYNWAWGQNLGGYGIEVGNPLVWRIQEEPLSDIINIFYPFHENVTEPTDTVDVYEMKSGKAVEMCWILNIKPLEWFALEGGYGYVHATHEYHEFDESWNDTRAFYGNMQFKIADLLEISPEFGIYWYGKERGYGRFTYGGAEIAVDF